MMSNHLTCFTVAGAAVTLGVKRQQIHRLINRGTLRGEKFFNRYIIEAMSVEQYQMNRRKAGRPRKERS